MLMIRENRITRWKTCHSETSFTINPTRIHWDRIWLSVMKRRRQTAGDSRFMALS